MVKAIALCLILFAIASFSRSGIKSTVPKVEAVRSYNRPNLSIVRVSHAGYGGAVSTIFWLNAILAYADVLFDGKSAGNLANQFALVTELDTNWAHPNLIAAWAIPQLDGFTSIDALPFLKNGTRRFPNQWKFRLTWAQYVLDAKDIDSAKARDSAATILLPLASSSSNEVPQYVRNLAFTLLHKNGKPEEAMVLLLQTYAEVPDPMVRYQFRGKMGDLLHRNQVPLGSDSANFFDGIGAMLESKDPADRRMAGQLLTDLVDSTRRGRALDAAHQLAAQYAAYSKK